MTFDHLIEYNMRLEKSYTKCDEEASPRSFNKIEHISGSALWSVIKLAFFVYPSGGLPKYIKTNVLTN